MTETVRPSPVEIELKLQARPADLAALRERIGRLVPGASSPVTRHLVTTYYDTPDLALAGRGVALRLRRAANRYSQSLKARHVPGSIKRHEWEWPLDGDRLEVSHLELPEIGALIPAHVPARLRPIFTTDVRRTTFRISTDGGSEIELALDEGTLKAGGATSPICEVELELKSAADEARGSAELYEIALHLHRAAPLVIATQSKADNGYALVAGRAALAAKATAIALTPQTSVSDGLSLTVRACLGQVLGNQAAVLAEDVHGVHQMRVGLRRLRAGFGLFRKFIGAADMRRFAEELKWLSGDLGRARDWDVLVEQTLPLLKQEAPGAVDGLIGAARKARHEAKEHLAAAVRSPRYTSLILSLGAWVESAGWRAALDRVTKASVDGPVSEVAGALLDRRLRQAAKAGKNIAELDPTERHELRKALKKLRYGASFLQSLYPEDRVRPYLHVLSELQDVLGTLNDLSVGRTLLTELDRSGGARGGAELSDVLAALDRRLAKSLDRLPKAWHRFDKLAPFWS